MPIRAPYRDAVRLLFILVNGSALVDDPAASGHVAIFKGEARLHAFDFWMRYPDYLAEELLDAYERTSNPKYLAAARQIFDDEEPDLRRFPMIRYRFGAYERLDDTLAVLWAHDLIRITGKRVHGKVRETDFLLMQSAFDLAAGIEKDFPILRWYAKRAQLVADVANGRGGKALKDRQYKQAEYAETQVGGVIPPIASRVRARLQVLAATAGGAP